MREREALRTWLESRARTPEDAVAGSKLVAAYVAAIVRSDRVKRKTHDTFAAMAAAIRSIK